MVSTKTLLLITAIKGQIQAHFLLSIIFRFPSFQAVSPAVAGNGFRVKTQRVKSFRKLLRRKQSSKISKISRNTLKSQCKSDIFYLLRILNLPKDLLLTLFLPRSLQKFLRFALLPSGSFFLLFSTFIAPFGEGLATSLYGDSVLKCTQGGDKASQILKKKHKKHSRSEKAILGSNSRNSGVFSEQFSEWHSRPNLCGNPILGATLGATLGIGWTPKTQPKFSEFFFSELGWFPRAEDFSFQNPAPH